MTTTRRSGLGLIALGLIGIAIFWLTDPRWGAIGRRMAGDNLMDAVHDFSAGTYVGLVGSAIVLSLGLWLVTRRVS